MNDQKNKARQAWSGSGDNTYNQETLKLLLNLPSTNFRGYNENTFETKIDLIIKNNKILDSVSVGEQVDIIFNETIFYAESGGQISDKGIIIGKDCNANIFLVNHMDNLHYALQDVQKHQYQLNVLILHCPNLH